MKHVLKVKHYVRYTDDFIILAGNEAYLKKFIPVISNFLEKTFLLELHPKKITICSCHRGIDFLGYNLFPHHRLLRTKTKQRIFRKLSERVEEHRAGLIDAQTLKQFIHSYLGVLSHADCYKLSQDLKNILWFA